MSKMAYHITDHARDEAQRRNIPIDVLERLLEAPGQIVDVHSQRKAYQSLVEFDGKLFVVRAIVENTDPLTVITVYRTSKLAKYWSDES